MKIYRVRFDYSIMEGWFPINQTRLETYLYPTIIFNVENIKEEEIEKIHEFLNSNDKDCILLALDILKNKCEILATRDEYKIYEGIQKYSEKRV